MIKNNKLVSEFKTFVSKGNAIDMAVGIIVGSVMTGLVNSLVKDVIMPPVGLLVGGVDFSQLFFVIAGGEKGVRYATIEAAQAAGATTVNLGLFLNSLVSFLITMFALFIFIRALNKVRGKMPKTRVCPYCKSVINSLATRCPNCCSNIKPIILSEEEKQSDLEKELKKISKIAKNKISKISKNNKMLKK